MNHLPENAPQWLKDADTDNARVEVSSSGFVTWHGGVWHGGVWRGGEWLGGTWLGGTWLGGTWHDEKTDRMLWHLACCGVTFDDDGWGVAYRTTDANACGRHTPEFIQTPGRIDVDHDPKGHSTCVRGLHVASLSTAWTYFGIDPTARLWRARFRMDDVLDCDGQKIRLRGCVCEEIPVPWQVTK